MLVDFLANTMLVWLAVLGLVVLYCVNKLFEWSDDDANAIIGGAIAESVEWIKKNRVELVANAWRDFWGVPVVLQQKKGSFRDYDEFLRSKNFERINFYDYIELCHCRDGKIKKTFRIAVKYKSDGTVEWLIYAVKDGKFYLIEDLKKYNLFEYISRIAVGGSTFVDFNRWVKYVNMGLLTPEVNFDEIVEYYKKFCADEDRKYKLNGDRWLKYCRSKNR